ncbi:MAG TPA: GNAT family N-acetyltransferase [Thermomicrobiales bacterium]|nr:GNAT family N-acetyltransferase [Thermomicrobiales bacterium]
MATDNGTSIRYTDSLDEIDAGQLDGGFFAGWPNPPSPENHLRMLRGSGHVWLAIDTGSGKVVGFVSAISDGVLAAYIPLLEVLRNYQHDGIGGELMHRMLETLSGIYMIDLLCDEELQPWYERLGMRRATGMLVRNYAAQSGSDS